MPETLSYGDPIRKFFEDTESAFRVPSQEVPGSDHLVDDSPEDDRTDNALKARSEVFAQADALQWLTDGVQPQAATTGDPSANTATEGASGPTSEDGSILRTIGEGVGELPRQIVGGLGDAFNSTMEFGDWLQSAVPLPGVQITDPETGNFDLKLLSGDDFNKEGVKGAKVPDVGQPKTVAGQAVRTISQFLGPFAAAGKAMGGIKSASAIASFGKASAAGGVADFLAFPAHEKRLSNVLQEFPALQNPVTEYLAASQDDTQIEGRLKNAIEGLGLGTVAEGLFRGIRAYRSLKRASTEAGGPDKLAEAIRTAETEQVLGEAKELNLLGSPDAPLVNPAREKLGRAAAEEQAMGKPWGRKGEGEVYINFARIEGPDDIKKGIADLADWFKGDIQAAQRGVRSNLETQLSADKIDAFDTLMKRRKGEPLNAEQSVAARQLWASSADKLTQVAKLSADNPTPENLFQFRRMLTVHHAIQKEVLAARSETARALQSWKIPAGGSAERMRDITSLLDRNGGSETAELLARKVAVLGSMPDGAGALTKFVEKTPLAKTLGAVQEYWINALLSGPKTHAVNMMSNTGVVGLSVLERSMAAKFGRMFSDEGVELGEAAAQVAGLRGGILDAFRNAGKAMRTGQTGFGMNKIELSRTRYISSGSWNVRSDSWMGRAIDGVGAVVNVPGRLLQAEDEFFKTIGYRMELHAQAHRMATREVAAGKVSKADLNKRVSEILDDPPEAIRMESAATAAYQTFTSEPGKITRWITRGMIDYPALRFVLPFINTPGNILKYTFERTPLAPLTSKYRNAIARGGAEADLARTRLAMGTVGLMLGIDLAMNGNSTGSGPTVNRSEIQNWRRQGYRPYSVKLGEKYYAYNRLDPLGYHLGIAADMAEYLMNAEADELTVAESQEAFAAGVFAIAENITSKSYLQGLSLLVEAVNDPNRFASSYLERFASSFVPTGVREIATFIDPVQRATHDVISSFKRKIPGMSEELPARRDLWGREISYQSGIGVAYDAVSPIYASGFKPEPIDLAMEKDGWYLGMGGYQFVVNGERVSLRNRPDIKNRYYQLRGGTKPSQMGDAGEGLIDTYGDKSAMEVLNEMVTGNNFLSDRWNEAQTPEDREDIARRVFRNYAKAAKKKLFQEYPWIEETAARLKAQRNQ